MHRPLPIPPFLPLRTLLQIWAGFLVQRIASNASRPADLSRLRRYLDRIRIVTTWLASRPRAATTAMLVPRDDLPWCDGGHATRVASLRTIHTGSCEPLFTNREMWDKEERRTRHWSLLSLYKSS